jgi:hypothetical protein
MKTKIVSNQTLLQLYDKFAYELEDVEKKVKLSSIAEVYYTSLMHSVIQSEIEVTTVHQRIIHQL